MKIADVLNRNSSDYDTYKNPVEGKTFAGNSPSHIAGSACVPGSGNKYGAWPPGAGTSVRRSSSYSPPGISGCCPERRRWRPHTPASGRLS